MGIKIEIDYLGSERRDFYRLRDELVRDKKKFTRSTLRLIPYDQLVLAAIGNAGAAACPLKLVQEEKQARRERFLDMEMSELAACSNHLKMERMYDDVMQDIRTRNAPYWDELPTLHKAWAKLVCIYNHLDDPHSRMTDGIILLRRAITEGKLSQDLGMSMCSRLKTVSDLYPRKIRADLFRSKVLDVASKISTLIPPTDGRLVVEDEQIRDFTCTSDCFRIGT